MFRRADKIPAQLRHDTQTKRGNGMTTEATKTVHNGERLLKVGQNRAVIVHKWFGLKTNKSARPTWNETLVVSGPVEWVRKQWK